MNFFSHQCSAFNLMWDTSKKRSSCTKGWCHSIHLALHLRCLDDEGEEKRGTYYQVRWARGNYPIYSPHPQRTAKKWRLETRSKWFIGHDQKWWLTHTYTQTSFHLLQGGNHTSGSHTHSCQASPVGPATTATLTQNSALHSEPLPWFLSFFDVVPECSVSRQRYENGGFGRSLQWAA